MPAIFPEPTTDLDQLKARVTWKAQESGLAVKLERLQFEGVGAAGSANGTYLYTGNGPGVIDLAADIKRADARIVWRYLPHAVSVGARDWVRLGIVAGKGHDGRLVLKGDLADFPFRDPAKGKFLVTAKATEGKVDYVTGWPTVENIEANLSFGVGMKIDSAKGTMLGAKVSDVSVEIPDFESFDEQLMVRGFANGPTSEFLRFIELSPVSKMIDRFTEGMKAKGNGKLDLSLDLPLRRVNEAKLRADYQLLNNQVDVVSALPTITGVNGRLAITEKSILANDIVGQVFGGPLKVLVKSESGKVGIQAAGTAKAIELQKHFRWPLMEHLAGSSTWTADINIRGRNADFVIESPLTGISASLPEPLNKAAEASWPLRIERSAPDATREQYKVNVGNKIAQALVVRRHDGKEMRAERSVIALGDADLRLPEKGLAVIVAAPRFDADSWKDLFAGEGAQGATQSDFALSHVAIKTPKLHLLGRDFSQADLTLRPREGGWQIALNMREAVGDLIWRSAGEGTLEGRLRRLVLRPTVEVAGGPANTLLNSLPSMTLAVDELYLGEKQLGQLDLKARNDKGAWQLDTLNIKNPDGTLRSHGVWQNKGRQQMRLDFDLAASDLGKLLDRLGYGDGVKRGSGGLSGSVEWDGPPTAIHYPSMSGKLVVNAEKGQFNKLEPGVGKLLGLLSLQSLTRRITLDFRDIFSDGLAFDSIDGKLTVKKGMMRTSEPLRIKGPAAQIEMEGEVDLKPETQNMRVVVRPELGAIAAVGVALINPVAGAATFLASSVIQNPLNRLFSYRYHVTGTWSDPLVDKAGQTEVMRPNVEVNATEETKEETKE
ncbi:MAG: TIGR02099 family protein [Dechloromonas sp.]|uniref:TIGR02099 family protein n=1 Tax=Candidatus Dechloromonas phosphorivorans TaxID=2899244 RepID=A0A935K843_9RHOO|nr:TIGR02099 family protein [Candidatus Dechloromonas phosphorivorans]